MKTSKLLTCTAIALVIAAPGIVSAKSHSAAERTALKKPLITTTTGLVDTTTNGTGTFDKVVAKEGKATVITTTDTFADGVTTTNVDTVHKTADGWRSNDIYSDNGQTTDTIKNVTKTSTGDTFTGKIIENGQTDTLSGTKTTAAYGANTTETVTNASDQTQSLDYQHIKSADASATVETGTGFNGQSVNNASLYTTNTTPGTHTGVNTVNGVFTYSSANNTANGVTTIANDRVYASGAGSSNVETKQTTSTGTNVNENTTNISSTGQIFTVATNETYTPTGTGTSNISGTFSQNNGNQGTVAGTYASTNYGSVNDQTYTNQSGATKVVDTQQLKVGDAILNINTDNTFAGTSENSVGLINVK